MRKVDSEAIAKALEKSRDIRLKTLQLTDVCLSDESVHSFSRFLQGQSLERLLLCNRTEQITMFPTGVSPGEIPRIKDSTMQEFIKSLMTVTSQSL